MSRVCIRSERYALCTTVFVVAFLLLCGRLFFLQVIQADTIAAEVKSVRERLVRLDSRRGNILDRHGDLLAGTRSRISLGLDPQVVDPREERKLALLAGMLEIPYRDILQAVENRERTASDGSVREVRWVPLKEIGEALYTSVEELGIRGVYGTRHYERTYPGGELAAHVIGFVNREDTPVMGVERAMDFYLRGQSGWRETEVDGLRRELTVFREREVPPRDGLHVQLTLDLYIQSAIESILGQIVSDLNPDAASIIVSDPGSGEILGLANYPTFDPNRFWDFPLANQRNRVITDQFEPGSTFKVVPLAAALEEGLVDPFDRIDCSLRRVMYRDVEIPMPDDHKELGSAPVWKVIAKSSNRGAAQLGMLLGEERLFEYARRFGFGRKTGWPLGAEIGGTLAAVEDWDGYTISRLPTGYAVGATVLQVHQAMAALANDGVLVRPKILRAVLDPHEGDFIKLGSDERSRVISSDTARTVKEILLKVVSSEGTARSAEIPGYAVAGKTGTARKIVDGVYRLDQHVGSFTGFFPAPDPEVVITVVVDKAEITGLAAGSRVAAPYFRQIAERLIPHLGIRRPENLDPFIVTND